MKAVIGGLLYDTETAQLIGEDERSVGDWDGYLGRCHEKYYRTRGGNYFRETRYKWAGSIWGHHDWTKPVLGTMAKEYAVQLKVAGKIQDKKLKIVNG